jgi:hypothetical protein
MKRQGSQLRKNLFYGLTLVLVSVFIYLAVQGNRMEKERLKQKADIVETVEPTPIRALNPQDLEILHTPMAAGDALVPGGPAAQYRIRVHNSGKITYSGMNIQLNFLDANGSELGSFSMDMKQKIPPGNTQLPVDIPADALPTGAMDFVPSIVYADMDPEG